MLNNFRQHYFQMGLLIYLQYSTLLVFSDRLSEAVGHARSGPEERYRESIERAATDLAIFTDRYWVTDVTNQVQGQELYELWVKRLRLRELYGQVKAEVEYVNGILSGKAQAVLAVEQKKLTETQGQLERSQAELSKRAYTLSRVGLPFLVLSVLFGLWGSNFFGECSHWGWYVGTGVIALTAWWAIWRRYLKEGK